MVFVSGNVAVRRECNIAHADDRPGSVTQAAKISRITPLNECALRIHPSDGYYFNLSLRDSGGGIVKDALEIVAPDDVIDRIFELDLGRGQLIDLAQVAVWR